MKLAVLFFILAWVCYEFCKGAFAIAGATPIHYYNKRSGVVEFLFWLFIAIILGSAAIWLAIESFDSFIKALNISPIQKI